MLRVCAWCNNVIGRVENSRHPDDVLSHGICEGCRENLLFQSGVSLKHYLDSLPLPVLVVDDDVRVLEANAKARDALGKDYKEITAHRGGTVFECAHARLPGGCGRTIHCSGCALRRAVTRTFQTGEPQSMVQATLSRADPDEPSAVSMLITTVKAGDAVFLRIDRIK